MMEKVIFVVFLALMLTYSVNCELEQDKKEPQCWEFNDAEDAFYIDWKEFQAKGTWYLYAQYIDDPVLMTDDPMPLVPAYDCGKIKVENYASKTYPKVLKPKFYAARYNYSDPVQGLNSTTARAWEGHSTLKDKNMDSPDFPVFGDMGVPIRYRIIETNANHDYVLLSICGLKDLPLPAPFNVTFQTFFFVTNDYPDQLDSDTLAVVQKRASQEVKDKHGNRFKLTEIESSYEKCKMLDDHSKQNAAAAAAAAVAAAAAEEQ